MGALVNRWGLPTHMLRQMRIKNVGYAVRTMNMFEKGAHCVPKKLYD